MALHDGLRWHLYLCDVLQYAKQLQNSTCKACKTNHISATLIYASVGNLSDKCQAKLELIFFSGAIITKFYMLGRKYYVVSGEKVQHV